MTATTLFGPKAVSRISHDAATTTAGGNGSRTDVAGRIQQHRKQDSVHSILGAGGLSESTMMHSIMATGAANAAGSNWRIQERIKTVAVGLVLCLHLGVDPPDILKTQPAAKLECWCDPFAPNNPNVTGGGEPHNAAAGVTPGNVGVQKALDTIGKSLVGQYEFWQPRARYKLIGDPTVEEVRKLAQGLRKTAKEERALLHWNGHGTPRPTKAGELWVFNRQFTQYIPLAVADVIGWLGLPCTIVLDCSSAGLLFDALLACLPNMTGSSSSSGNAEGRMMIILAACQGQEILPMSPELPADLFTSCLTTPLEIAIRWHLFQSGLLGAKLKGKSIDAVIGSIPGRLNDRKTVLGELHWIFTAITDTIAWCLFPRETFKALFRQDLMTASLFRNFLLAQRLMKSYQCNAMSWPPVPLGCSTHKLWLVWDHILDEALCSKVSAPPSGQFFTEQMDAFESWLDYQAETSNDQLLTSGPSEHLPIVLQVLLSQSHRARALSLLAKYFDLGPSFAKDALDIGILPYILKLLQSPCYEIRPVLLGMWMRVLAYDPTTRKDLGKDDAYLYFVRTLLDEGMPEEDEEERTMAALCLSVYSHYSPSPARQESLMVLPVLMEQITVALMKHANSNSDDRLLWAVNCMSSVWEGNAEAKLSLAKETGRDLFNRLIVPLCNQRDWRLRASACHALSTFISPDSLDLPAVLLELEQDMMLHCASSLLMDASEEVRVELTVCLSVFIMKHFNKFALAAYDIWEHHGDSKNTSSSPQGTEDALLVPLVTGDIVRNPSIFSILWEVVLALSLDPSEQIARLAASLVDEIHMSFLFIGPSSITTNTATAKEVFFVDEARRSPSPLGSTELKQPLAKSGSGGKFFLPSALPLSSAFIPSCHAAHIQKRRSEDNVEASRVIDEAIITRHLSECVDQGGASARFERQIALLAHGSLPTRLSFHPLIDRLIVSDNRNRLSVWDWGANTKGSFFVNGNPEKASQISGLITIPPPHSDRLLVASTDGVVRCWQPDYQEDGQHPADLIAVHQMVATTSSSTATSIFEADYQWGSCFGVASEDQWIHAWDLEASRGTKVCRLYSDPPEGSAQQQLTPTAIRASRHHRDVLFVGFSTGLLSEYDIRAPNPKPSSTKAHDSWLVDLAESPVNPYQLISASVLGDLCIHDRRAGAGNRIKYDLLSGGNVGLLTFAGHEVMPVLAVGSTDQALRFLTLSTSHPSMSHGSSSHQGIASPTSTPPPPSSSFALHTVKYHEGLFGQRIGSPATAAFHPNRPLYASAGTDMVIALYSTSSYEYE